MEKITIKINESVVHTLDGNASTGYIWNYVVENPAIISIQDEIKRKALNAGAANDFCFHIKGTLLGRTKIVFEYKRPWETAIAPLKKETILVEVK